MKNMPYTAINDIRSENERLKKQNDKLVKALKDVLNAYIDIMHSEFDGSIFKWEEDKVCKQAKSILGEVKDGN